MSGGEREEAAEPSGGFAERLLVWYDRHGRRDLPWHRPATAYRVWISEIMLQQTRVETVRPYFTRFVERFPDVHALAQAPLDEVLAHWSGLGYYARARNLHRAAGLIVAEHGGEPPDDLAALEALPGIGRSTAGAIQSLARGHRAAILDGNVKRVLARHAGVAGWPGRAPVQRALWAEAEKRLPRQRVGAYNQALMDLGAGICQRRPRCADCPVAGDCVARAQGRTVELPAPKPKRAWPTREGVVLVLQHAVDDTVLLERRPAHGIWGGLWSLPEFPDLTTLQGWLATRGITAAPATLPPLEHGFTHFRYRMHPCHVCTKRLDTAEQGQEWARPEQPPGGLPAPIKRLLDEVVAVGAGGRSRP